MAAYAALISLKYILDQLQHHPFPPISLDKEQVESLTEIATFLQEFLEGYTSPVAYRDEADPLETRIADAAYAAEDVIEAQIVEIIHNRSTIIEKMFSCIKSFGGLCRCADEFNQDLQQVIANMDLIKKEVMEIVRKKTAVQDQLQRKVSSTHADRDGDKALTRPGVPLPDAGSSTHAAKDSMMVGFDDVLLQVLDKLTGGQPNRQIIPIMGMGGIGKTTLARNIFENALIKEHFDICVWTTISQVYNTQETLREILRQARGYSSDLSEEELGVILCKHLSARRYLIVLDDIWSVEAWDKMKFSFPDYNNGSRIIVTTRLSNFTSQLSESFGLDMEFLDEASSWDLFSKTVFGEDSFPLELEKIGKKIVTNCRGLPLSIVTIGGLLDKSERTRKYWEHIEGNLNSIVINKNDEFCLKILRMSYIHLPSYLKPCFLYMCVFEEDCRIRVSTLKKLWVSEGFLKPLSGECLETTADEYLKELVDRNLILVKYCKIHDLLRDLCLREAKKERFYHVPKRSISQLKQSIRLVVIRQGTDLYGWYGVSDVLYSLSHVRSIMCDHMYYEFPFHLKLLRIFKAYDRLTYGRKPYVLTHVLELVNLRHLAFEASCYANVDKIPSSFNQLWNLHTFIVKSTTDLIAPVEIWKMPQLRHVEVTCGAMYLPDPPSCDADDIVIMENLQTLRGVMDFNLNEEMVKRIPNIKKLCVEYNGRIIERGNCLSYLQCLSKLESFFCSIRHGSDEYLQKISFPHSLKKCTLVASFYLELEELLEKIGSLPLLQKLVLYRGSFGTRKWETIEGKFPSLKVLSLSFCRDLEDWTMSESSHFPRLEELRLEGLSTLKEIPSEIGEIPMLKSVILKDCSESVVVSAKDIVEEQEEFQGVQPSFHVRVACEDAREAKTLQYLSSPNFHVQV